MRNIRTLSMSTPRGRTTTSALEEQFKCCICQHLYSDPVTIPCAHNFCLSCIQGYWAAAGRADCPLCKHSFRTAPALRINREFQELIGFMKRSPSLGEDEEEEEEEEEECHSDGVVPCDVCAGTKSAAVSSCLVCQASYCEAHVQPHRSQPALLRWHRLADPATFGAARLCRTHGRPLTMFCKKEQVSVCERCAAGSHRRHQVVPLEQESARVKAQLKTTKSDIHKMIQARLRKMEEISDSVDLSQKMTEREIQRGAEVCGALTAAILGQQAALAAELQEKQGEAERRAQRLLGELEREVAELQARGGRLHGLELTPDPLHLLQVFPALGAPPPATQWAQAELRADHSLGAVRRGVAKLLDACHKVVDTLFQEEGEQRDQYSVDVTFDPDTASAWLTLSPDLKKVSVSRQQRAPLPHLPQRFDTCVCVLGKQSFTCGRRYWEVQVGDKTDWDVGVARRTVNRKGAITVRPDGGYWAICRRKGGSLSACTSPCVSLQETPQRVGVFLDYEEGAVSFYDADTKRHIYTYSGCAFSEPLHPYFNPCVPENGRNTGALLICPSANNNNNNKTKLALCDSDIF